jgi:2-polyprenyl-3-methyl-5-hydroxy-6-metoxy-1,4-benzoquinol methylase
MENTVQLETIPCPLCASTAFAVVYPGNFPNELSQEFLTKVYCSSSDQTIFEQVVRCNKCELVYLNPRLHSDVIVDSYAQGEDATFVEQDLMRIRTFVAALQWLRRKYRLRFSKETKVLDIGCAGGAFLRAAQSLGLSAVGVEPSKWLGEYARSKHGLEVYTGTLFDHPFPEASFDVVTLWDVIEHVPDPSSELKEVYRILKPEGLLVVNYPDFGSLASMIMGKKWPFLLSVHLVYYTRKTIRRQLAKAGFRVSCIRLHWQTLELRYVLKRAAAYFPFLKFVGILVEKLGIGSFPLKYWIGQTQVVAKKKYVQ